MKLSKKNKALIFDAIEEAYLEHVQRHHPKTIEYAPEGWSKHDREHIDTANSLLGTIKDKVFAVLYD